MTPSNKIEFACHNLVFAKVIGYPYWPAKITNVDSPTSKYIKYGVEFFATKETATVSKTYLRLYANYKSNYPLDSVALKYRTQYKIALEEIKVAWEAECLTSSNSSLQSKSTANTPSNKVSLGTPRHSTPVVNERNEAIGSSQDETNSSNLESSKNVTTRDASESTPIDMDMVFQLQRSYR